MRLLIKVCLAQSRRDFFLLDCQFIDNQEELGRHTFLNSLQIIIPLPSTGRLCETEPG
jgi:hypothetical protein